MKELEALLCKINIYASKHGIIDGLTIQFESDGSGVAFKYFDKSEIFRFNNLSELYEILDDIE